MKSLYLLIVLTASFTLYGQHDMDGQGILFNTSNKVGVGTTAPETILHIKQSTRHEGLTITEEGNSERIKLHLAKFDDGREYGFFMLGDSTMLRGNGERSYFKGSLGIGTTNPDAKLTINGDVHAKEIRLDLNGWPDYVFATKYKLRSLEEIKKHIAEKGHLPDVPSAQQMESQGLNVAEMDKLLMQKVEELTLYMIELNEENAQLRKEVQLLKSIMETHEK